MRTIRVLIRRAAISLAVTVAVLALLLVFFSSGPGERIIRGTVEARLSVFLDRRVVIGRLETNLFSRLSLEHVSISGETERSAPIQLDRCNLEYSLSRLHRRSLVISSVELDGFIVTIERDSTGAHNMPFPRGGGDGAERPPVSIELGTIRVERARIDYRDDSGNSCGIADLGLTLSMAGDDFYRYRVSISSCTGTHDGIEFEMGDISAEGNIEPPFTAPHIETSAIFSSLEIAGLQVKEGAVELSYDTTHIVLQHAEMRAAGGSFSASGSLAVDSLQDYTLSLEIEDIDIPTLWRFFGDDVSPYEGDLAGRFEGTGRLVDVTSWLIAGEMDVSRCSYRGKAIEDFSGRFDLRQGRLSARVHQDYFEIAVEAALWREELDGRFTVRISDLEPVAALIGEGGVRGALHVDGVLSGTKRDPAVRADIEGRGIEYLGFPIDTVDGAVSVRGRSIELSGVTFSGRLDALGSLGPPFRIPELEGGLEYRGSAEGVLERIRGNVRIELFQPSYRGIGFDGGIIEAFAEGPGIEIRSIEFRRDTLLVRGKGDIRRAGREGACELTLIRLAGEDALLEGNVSRDRGARESGRLGARFEMPADEWRISARGRAVDVGWAASLVPRSVTASGMLDFELEASGKALPANATLRFRAVDPGFGGAGVDSLEGIVSLGGTLLRSDSLELFFGDDRVRLSASLQLAGDASGGLSIDRRGAFSGSARGEALDLGLLEPFLPEGVDVGGFLTLDASWSGTLERIRPTGRLSLAGGSARIRPDDPPLENIFMEASIVDSVLVIDELTGSLQDRPFAAEGEFKSEAGSRIGMDLRLTIERIATVRASGSYSPDSLGLTVVIDRMDLALIQPYLSGLDGLSGILSTEIRADGPPAGPRLSGLLTIRRLSIQPRFMAEPFDGGIVRIVFDRENIAVDSLLLRKGSGSLFVSGSVAHDRGSIRTIDLTADIDRMDFEKERSYLVSLESASLRYRTQGEQFLLDGDVVLGETRIRADFKPQSILPFARSVERPVQEPPEFLERTKIDVRIRESDEVWIDNNIARIRMRADLGIIGSAARPNLTGRISVVKGYILFIDRKFKIEDGTIDFIDPNRLNPVITLKAATRVTSYREMEATPYTVTLSVTGPLDEAAVELYSEPPLDRANIVSLLTLGVTREQLSSGGEGGDVSTGGILVDRAKALTSDRVGGYISRNVEDLLQLDQVTIEGNLFDFESSWGPQLLASKKISDRTTVTYRTNVGHLNDRSVMLDYRLTERFSLSGETDQYGRSGIDLKFTIRLK